MEYVYCFEAYVAYPHSISEGSNKLKITNCLVAGLTERRYRVREDQFYINCPGRAKGHLTFGYWSFGGSVGEMCCLCCTMTIVRFGS